MDIGNAQIILKKRLHNSIAMVIHGNLARIIFSKAEKKKWNGNLLR